MPMAKRYKAKVSENLLECKLAKIHKMTPVQQ